MVLIEAIAQPLAAEETVNVPAEYRCAVVCSTLPGYRTCTTRLIKCWVSRRSLRGIVEENRMVFEPFLAFATVAEPLGTRLFPRTGQRFPFQPDIYLSHFPA